MPTQPERSAATREKLLDAAIDALVACGHARASLPEICRRAGVSRGAQLHHFPTRADLLAAAVEHLFARRIADFRDRLATTRPDSAGLLEAVWDIYRSGPVHAWQELVVASRVDPELRAAVARVDARFGETAGRTLAALYPPPPGVSAEATARMISCLLEGLAANQILRDDDALASDVLALFLRMLQQLFTTAPDATRL